MKHSKTTIIIALFSITAFLFTREQSASMQGSASTNMSSDVKLDYFEDKYIGVVSYVLESKIDELSSKEEKALQTFTEGTMSKDLLRYFESALRKHDCFKLKNPNKANKNNLIKVPNFMDTPDWFFIDCAMKDKQEMEKKNKKMRKKLNKLKKKFKNK